MIHEKIYYPGKEKVYLESFILDDGMRFGESTKRPAVIVCPGGGYVYLSPREGEPVAAAYSAKGFQTFVLHYSIGWDVKNFTPLQEIDWAVGLVRKHADEWYIDEKKIFACGFSAGGHLALSGALLDTENKPDGLILGYPAVSLESRETTFLTRILTGKDELEGDERKWINLSESVTDSAPPLFVFTTAEDALTCRACLQLVSAYADHGLPCEFHLFQQGTHGLSLADASSADGSSRDVNPHVAKWLDLSAEWVTAVSGGLKFKDFSTSHIKDAVREMGVEIPGEKNEKDIRNA